VRRSGDGGAYRRGVHSLAGLAALGVVGLWLAYLVPHRLRHRQQLLESRTDDRYSGSMRVLAVADRKAARRRAEAVRPVTVSGTALLTPARGTRIVAAPARGATGGGNMDRPHESNEKRVVDARRRIAQRHAQRAAVLARRSAAARRRLVLVVVLLLVTAGAWTAVGLGVLAVAGLAAIPSALLVATVLLGRAAVVSGQRADAAWAREEAALTKAVEVAVRRSGPVATGRAVRGSDDDTLVIEKVTDLAPSATSDETSWQPVPVPRPTYTLKSPAPRREPAPREIPERVVAEPAVAASAEAERAAAGASERPAANLDLDAILARRRAVGQ